ncbi:MAG: hypothetical protein QW767_00200 [Thermoprotei archaeon]
MSNALDYEKILRSQPRREILIFLAENGPSRFIDIKNGTGLATGVIYHHLRSLGPLVVKTDSKSYALTDLGLSVVSFMNGSNLRVDFRKSGSYVNDVWLEETPRLARAASTITLAPVMKAAESSRPLAVAILFAALEFLLLLTFKAPVFTVLSVGIVRMPAVASVISLLLLYVCARIYGFLVSGGSYSTNSGSERKGLRVTATVLYEAVNPPLASGLALGICVIYVSGWLSYAYGQIGSLVSLPLTVWGVLVLAQAVSFFEGTEFITSVIFPFTASVVVALVDSAYNGSIVYQPVQDLVLVSFIVCSITVARWADSLMKTAAVKLRAQ